MGHLLGGSIVALMATSSKTTYAIRRASRSAAARAPVPVAGHCWPVPLQETLKHSKAGLPPSPLVVTAPFPGSWCTQCFVCTLQASLGGMRFDSKWIRPFLPSCWDFLLALEHGICFLVRFNILLSMVYQQLAEILVFTQEKMSACPIPPSCQ